PISLVTDLILFGFNSLWALALSSQRWSESKFSFRDKIIEQVREYCICFGVIILFGASLYRHPLESLYLALHLSFRLQPSQYFHFNFTSYTEWIPLFIIWISPITFLLDWNEAWQTFPYPVLLACEVSCILKKLPHCFESKRIKVETE
ncbi:hypothetical protein HMI55_003201, partial [Coelomomyces lativittatus]